MQKFPLEKMNRRLQNGGRFASALMCYRQTSNIVGAAPTTSSFST